MARLSLTLDDETFAALAREARRGKIRVGTYARRLLRAAIAHGGPRQRRRRWVEAYRADRADAVAWVRNLDLDAP